MSLRTDSCYRLLFQRSTSQRRRKWAGRRCSSAQVWARNVPGQVQGPSYACSRTFRVGHALANGNSRSVAHEQNVKRTGPALNLQIWPPLLIKLAGRDSPRAAWAMSGSDGDRVREKIDRGFQIACGTAAIGVRVALHTPPKG